MTIPEVYSCILCGTEGGDVEVSLVEWAEPDDHDSPQHAAWALERWTSAPRCRGRQACRDRVEGAGGAWEVRDRTTVPSPAKAAIREAVDEDVEVPAWM